MDWFTRIFIISLGIFILLLVKVNKEANGLVRVVDLDSTSDLNNHYCTSVLESYNSIECTEPNGAKIHISGSYFVEFPKGDK